MNPKRTKFAIREDKQEKIEVHVAGFCFRRVGGKLQLLVGKRRSDRELFPDKWECGGGQVRAGENFEEALFRQYFEEFGIKVNIISPIVTYQILRAKKPKIPGLKFLCISADNGKEEIVLNAREFTDFRWVTETQCMQLKMIPGVHKDAKYAFSNALRFFPNALRSKQHKLALGFQPNRDASS